MTDPVPDTKAPGTRWMWVGVIVVMAIVFIGVLFLALRPQPVETIPDYAITTEEERLNPDGLDMTNDDLPPINSAENSAENASGDEVITAEGGEVEVIEPTQAPE